MTSPIAIAPKKAALPLMSDQAWSQHTATLRQLIWLYLLLWLIEGGLRRWFFPGLATPLLLIRDPVVLLIYAMAASKNLFPRNDFIFVGAVLAVLNFANALLIGHGNPAVALYGVRSDFLHVPMIFIMGRVLRQKDLLFLAKFAVILAIPYTALLVAQFYAPQAAWVNRGVGGSEEGAGFGGALDRFRPPGTFSFISGPQILYPLLTACWFMVLFTRQLPTWLTAIAGAAILVAIPISISRTLFLGTAIVTVTGVCTLFFGGRLSMKNLIQCLLVAILLPVIATKIPAFKDGLEAFVVRWESATDDQGGIKIALIDRVLNDLAEPFKHVTATGLGTGFSSNVGQKLLTQEVGFGASEGEWGRLLYDNGLFLGVFLVAYRVALSGYTILIAWRAFTSGYSISLIFASAAFFPLFNTPWGMATNLGGAVIGTGLTLAAANALNASAVRPAITFNRRNRSRPRASRNANRPSPALPSPPKSG